MDLLKTIRELHEEKKRLDRVIASLEQLQAEGLDLAPSQVKSRSRRGRKGMSDEERREVSERMTRYWASRRMAKQGGVVLSSESAAAGS